MNDFIRSIFISQPPAPARGGPDPLLPIRRSFGEGDLPQPQPSLRPSRRTRSCVRVKRAAAPS
jgi:hypothetical protein